MKLVIINVLLGFILTSDVYSQNVLDGVYTKSNYELIQSIDKLRKDIKDKIPTCRLQQFISDKENVRNVFKQNNEIVLITVSSTDKNIEKKVSWYFDNGKLIFCEQTWLDKASYELVDHEKFYVDNNRLISWIKTDNTTIDYTSEEFRKIDKSLAAYADKLKDDSMKQ